MRFRVLGLRGLGLGALALCALGPVARGQSPGRPPTAPAEVSIRFAALDEKNEPVASLGPEDISVEEGGRTRAVTSVRRLSGPPLSLVVAVDTSASQERVAEATKLAADAFVRGVMRPGVDEFGVVTFTGAPTLEQAPTGDAEKVRAAVARIKVVIPPGYVGGGIVVGRLPSRPSPAGSTAIWDAVSYVSREVLARAPAPRTRALILVTDGVDTSSRLELAEAVADALRAEAVVYAVGLGDEKAFDGVNEGELRKLTGRTGGRVFFPKKADELPAIFARIQNELLSPYVVTFARPAAPRDGSFRKVKIEIANPELRRRGVKLTYPQGYFDGDPPAARK